MLIAVAGATGRTGRLIVQRARARGHTVRALIRADAPATQYENLTWVTGSIDDPHALKSLLNGSEVVISALGPRKERIDVCSVATANLIAAGAPRLIVVSGMGLTLPGDRKSPLDKAVARMVALLSRPVYEDKVREIGILQASSIPWTAVRVGALLDGVDIKPVKVDRQRPPGFAINAGSLAAFCVSEAEDARYIEQAPFVAF